MRYSCEERRKLHNSSIFPCHNWYTETICQRTKLFHSFGGGVGELFGNFPTALLSKIATLLIFILSFSLSPLLITGKLEELNNNNNSTSHSNGNLNNKWGGGGGGGGGLGPLGGGSSCNSLSGNKSNLHVSGLQNQHHSSHHHHHAAVAAAALASPFSSLLTAGGSAGYLLDPLGGLNKSSSASNHLF